MMTLVFRSLLLTLVLALVTAGSLVNRGSSGNSAASTTSGNYTQGGGGGSSSQLGELGNTSVNTSGGANVSVEQRSDLDSAAQVTDNQAFVQALQGASRDGSGSSQKSSNDQVNIASNQQQKNVNGTLVNVHEGNEGVVIINTNDGIGAMVNQTVMNDQPIANQTEDSSGCRYMCRRPHNNQLYCCDNGTNHNGKPKIHGGQCPAHRFLCSKYPLFTKCAHDGQCADGDKCCYHLCQLHHICKTPDPAQ